MALAEGRFPILASHRHAEKAQMAHAQAAVAIAQLVMGMFMAILDIQIVASSLPQIQAGVGASADKITWVQTFSLIAEIVMIPLSGWLARVMSTR